MATALQTVRMAVLLKLRNGAITMRMAMEITTEIVLGILHVTLIGQEYTFKEQNSKMGAHGGDILPG